MGLGDPTGSQALGQEPQGRQGYAQLVRDAGDEVRLLLVERLLAMDGALHLPGCQARHRRCGQDEPAEEPLPPPLRGEDNLGILEMDPQHELGTLRLRENLELVGLRMPSDGAEGARLGGKHRKLRGLRKHRMGQRATFQFNGIRPSDGEELPRMTPRIPFPSMPL